LYVIIINILGNLYNKLYHLFSRFGGIIHFLSFSALYMNYLPFYIYFCNIFPILTMV
jgi:hypothetical protein